MMKRRTMYFSVVVLLFLSVVGSGSQTEEPSATPQTAKGASATEANEPDEEDGGEATAEEAPEEVPSGVSDVVIDKRNTKLNVSDPTKGYLAILSVDEKGKKRQGDTMKWWSFYFDAKFRMKRPGKNVKGHPKGGYAGIFVAGFPTGKHTIRLVAKPSNNYMDTDFEIVPNKVLFMRIDARDFSIKPYIDEVKYLSFDEWRNSRFQTDLEFFNQILYVNVKDNY